jgi:hypothetical protein
MFFIERLKDTSIYNLIWIYFNLGSDGSENIFFIIRPTSIQSILDRIEQDWIDQILDRSQL